VSFMCCFDLLAMKLGVCHRLCKKECDLNTSCSFLSEARSCEHSELPLLGVRCSLSKKQHQHSHSESSSHARMSNFMLVWPVGSLVLHSCTNSVILNEAIVLMTRSSSVRGRRQPVILNSTTAHSFPKLFRAYIA